MSGSSKKGLSLSELRSLGVVDENPNARSIKTWILSANHCAEQAQLAEDEGRQEDAFVGYLRALGLFQAFLSHKEYPKIRSESSKPPFWPAVMDFQSRRSEYIERAKSLTERLKQRDVEQMVSGSGSSTGSHTPSVLSQPPTAPGPSQTANQQTKDEPDLAPGGSIASRLAALRGAGMNAQTSNKRLSKDGAPGNPAEATLRRDLNIGSSADGAQPVGPPSRRSSAASTSNSGYGAAIGATYRPSMRVDTTPQLENSQTGSSYASARSAAKSDGQQTSGPTSPAITPQRSGNDIKPPTPPVAQSSSINTTTNFPSVSSHFHKFSLPNMPTTPREPSGDASPKEDGPSPEYSKQPRLDHLATSSSASNLPADDVLAQFTHAFPSLTDFESSSEFATSPITSGPQDVKRLGGVAGRPHTIPEDAEGQDGEETSLGFPKLPSPPRNAPGGHAASSLGANDVPARPRSLPEPDTAMGTTIGGKPVDGSYFPSPPLDAQTAGAGGLSTSPSSRDIPSLTESSGTPNGTPPPVAKKPLFPYTNAIQPRRLKEYLINPAVKVLLLDVRDRSEYDRGHVGKELSKGLSGDESFDVVWIDPTLLSRPGMDSVKLENALSVSPIGEQKAFENRDSYDVVVIYDDSSTSFPLKGERPNAMSMLYNIIFVDAFRKSLQRSPVALVGGYRAWMEEGQRSRSNSRSGPLRPIHAQEAGSSIRGPPPPIPMKKSSLGDGYSSSSNSLDSAKRMRRETPLYKPSPAYATSLADSFHSGLPQSMSGTNVNYAGRPLPSLTAGSVYSSAYGSSINGGPAPPPAIASHPGVSRRRSDYMDQHNQPYSGYTGHSSPRPSSLEYPRVDGPGIPQPPPPVASPSLDRQDTRPRAHRSASVISYEGLANMPTADQVAYWNDVAVGMSGLKNLGNTCYMNSTIQCLSATYPLARFFLDGSFKRAINTANPMGTKGDLAKAFATLVSMLWKESYTFLSPVTFRKSISMWAPSFAGSDQQDSQEFLSFLLDGLHEDLNRIRTKPPPVEMTPEREAALETLPPAVAAEKEWKIYKMRNDSLIVDLFQGQYRNRMECLTCHKTSTTYDAFMYMSLPVPTGKTKVVIQQLIDNFVQTEVMEKAEAWNCPRCKVPRKATKSLSIARLPPVLLIHLKRFSTKNGVFWDKSETPVIFPVKGLDLTRYMPPTDPSIGLSRGNPDDPRSMRGPFKYDLFAVSNHMGSLSSGHYTAFVHSSKGWQYCDDSKISQASERDVVAKPAYILFYKRVQV